MRAAGSKNTLGTFTMALYAIFVLMVLFLMIMGTLLYKERVDERNAANIERASLSYVTSCVAAGDSANALTVSYSAPESRALVLREAVDDEVFETRLYLYQGNLVEEYAAATHAYTPTQAYPIVETERFDFSFDAESNLLTINTDTDSQTIALCSVQEASF